MIKSRGVRIFNVFNIFILSTSALTCVLPFLHIIAISFSSNAVVAANLVSFWPKQLTTYAYEYLLNRPRFWQAFGVTIKRVLLGGTINMLLTLFTAYPLSKSKEAFRMRSVYVWIIFFTSLFSGGLIPTYMLLNQMSLLDTLWSLVLPGAVPVFNIILMLNFYKEIPSELEDAAYIDGAGHLRTMIQIYLPCSLPSIATLTLFVVVNHWNAWFDGLIYMNQMEHYPLQSYIQTVIHGFDLTSNTNLTGVNDYERIRELSSRTLKNAQVIIATVPVLIVYPLLQKYFVTGLTMGSVKG